MSHVGYLHTLAHEVFVQPAGTPMRIIYGERVINDVGQIMCFWPNLEQRAALVEKKPTTFGMI